MKITEVRVILTCPGRNYVLVKVLTDEGVYGVGDGTLNGSELAVAAAIEHLSHLLIGMDPQRIENIWYFLYHHTYWRGGPVYAAAIGVIDIALWDIKGKVAGMPVYQLLGGAARDKILCYGHAGGRSPQEVEESVRRLQAKGYRVIRAQIGGYGGSGMVRTEPSPRPGIPPAQYFDPTPYMLEHVKLFEYLRRQLGDSVELCHDVHEQLTPIQAAWLAKQLEPYRLFFLEDPLPPEQIQSFALVRQASTTPLAMGEIVHNRYDALPLLQNRWIDYLRCAPMHIGGITEMRKVAAVAETFGVRMAFHGAADLGPIAQAAAVHLDMVIPNFGVQEWVTFPEEAYEVMPGACEFRDGYAYPPERPGIGLDINEELAARYPYQRAFMPLVRREDGTMHRY